MVAVVVATTFDRPKMSSVEPLLCAKVDFMVAAGSKVDGC